VRIVGRVWKHSNTTALTTPRRDNTFPGNTLAADGSFWHAQTRSAPTCRGTLRDARSAFPPSVAASIPRHGLACFLTAPGTAWFTSGKFDLTPTLQLFARRSFYKERDQVGHPADADLGTSFIHSALNKPLANQFSVQRLCGPAGRFPDTGNHYAIRIRRSASRRRVLFIPRRMSKITGGATPDLLVRWRAALIGNRDLNRHVEGDARW